MDARITYLCLVGALLIACTGDGHESAAVADAFDAVPETAEVIAAEVPDEVADVIAGEVASEVASDVALDVAPPAASADRAAELLAALERGLAASGARNAIAGVRFEGAAADPAHQGARWIASAGPDHLAPDATFRVGSVTKMAVSVVALRLVAAGLLTLDDPIARWFSTVPDADRITVRMLLNHTSGAFDYLHSHAFEQAFLADPHHAHTLDTLFEFFDDGPTTFPPGARFAYSNTNYLVLGGILEAVTHRSIASLLHAEVLDPLALTATYYPPEDAPAATVPAMAPGYSRFFAADAPAAVAVQDAYSPTVAGAAGALVSNVPDLLTLLASLRTRVPGELANQWQTTIDSGSGFGYGLGLMVFDLGPVVAYGHLGTIWGYQTIALVSPEGGFALVVMLDTEAVDVNAALVPLLDVLAPL